MRKWSKPTLKLLERARQLVRARDPKDVPNRSRGESRVIERTSDWFHDDPNICGLGIGYRYDGQEITDHPAIHVFVHRKNKSLPARSRKRIRPFKLHGKNVET